MTRSMNLGKLIHKIDLINQQNPETCIYYHVPERESPDCYEGIGDLFSWRGDYSELCLEPTGCYHVILAEQLLCRLRGAIGMSFKGYKGGDFLMSEDTPVWKGWHGDCNTRYHQGIIDVDYDGNIGLIITELMDCWE